MPAGHDSKETDSKKVLLEEHGFHDQEFMEVEIGTFTTTSYPKPSKRYRFIFARQDASIEQVYFWFLDSIRHDWGVNEFDKIIDAFAASEQSAFFGTSQQRIGIQQDKVSTFLAAIGKMVKELFQFVRELRILDERLSMYNDSMSKESKSRKSAEISLKGIWIDLVEGGSKTPSSVYGMAREVGFTILPDLFFSVHPTSIAKIDLAVDSLVFNRKVKEVLKRKLRTYMEWKRATHSELTTRRKFTLQYFRQHYDIIRMYMNWLKPYLRNIERLGMDYKKMSSADLVSAFEGSMIEVEVLARKKKEEFGKYTSCIVLHFMHRTRPQMSFQTEGYQRGPVHMGKVEVTMRAYGWTDDQIENYKEMRKDEDLQLLTTLDDSLKLAMESLGDELKKYLKEAGEKIFADEEKKKKEGKPKRPSVLDPFLLIGGGLKEMFGSFSPAGLFKGFSSGGNSRQDKKDKEKAEKDAQNSMWRTFKNYRKAHRMVTW